MSRASIAKLHERSRTRGQFDELVAADLSCLLPNATASACSWGSDPGILGVTKLRRGPREKFF